MKRLSHGLLSLAFLLALASLGFSATPAKAPPPPASRDIDYYWYDTTDTYTGYFQDVFSEELRLEDLYGVVVDQNSIGGTLLEKGYVGPGKPHMSFPGAFLYGHFLR